MKKRHLVLLIFILCFFKSSHLLAQCTKPTISVQPTGKSGCEGTSATISVNSPNTNSYQWHWSGASGGNVPPSNPPWSGATSNSLTITSLTSGVTGNYWCVLTNSCGSTTSASVSVSLNSKPGSQSITGATSVCLGATGVKYDATVIANASNYIWTVPTGATITTSSNSPIIYVNYPSGSVSGNVTVHGNNACGDGPTTTLPVSVNAPVTPSVSISADKTNICSGSNVTFTATPVNGGSPTYQWLINGSAVNGATGNSFSTTGLTNGQQVSVVMTTSLSCVTSTTATSNAIGVTVNTAPTISVQPTNRAACEGASTTLSVSSPNATSYQWYWNASGGSTAVPPSNPPWSGQTTNTLSIILSSGTTAGQYWVILTNSCGTATSASVSVSMNYKPGYQSITGAASVCLGTTGAKYDATVISNASNYIWTVPTGATITTTPNSPVIYVDYPAGAVSGNVTVHGNNACGDGPTTTLPVSVNAPVTPSVSISADKTNICLGSNVTFTATPVNGGSPTYQWLIDGSAVNGATGNSFSTTSLTNGQHVSVIMTTGLSCVTSTTATSNAIGVTVNTAPTISVQPANRAACEGASATLSVSSPNTTSYQWYWNGTGESSTVPSVNPPWSGQATNTLSIILSSGTTGQYWVVLTNSCGTATSAYANISMNPKPGSQSITGAPSVCLGATGVKYDATVIANASNYIWTVPTGATITTSSNSPIIYVDYPSGSVSGNVTVYGNNACGDGPTTTLPVSVNDLVTPSVSISADKTNICSGSNATFTATPTNGGSPTYQWLIDGSAVNGATGNSFSTTGLTNGQQVNVVMTTGLSCVTANTATSNSIGITINTLPVISKAPVTPITCAGTIITFNVVSPNTDSYEWHWSGTTDTKIPPLSPPWTGQTTETLTISSISTGMNGSYWVVLTNNCGSVESNKATLTVPTAIEQQPQNATLYPGDNVIFSVTVSSYIPVTYQWRKDGVAISGANTSSYSINKLQKGDVANYDVVITAGNCPAITSDAAELKVYSHLEQNYNYIITRSILQDNIKNESETLTLPFEGVQELTTYYDGLGRPIQNVTTGGSPSKEDIVQPIVYDDFGRETTKYLPYTDGNDGSFKTNALADPTSTATTSLDKYHSGQQYLFYQNQSTSSDQFPYSQTVFESSPLNRVFEQGATGTAWQPLDASGNSTGHTQKLGYNTNNAYDVILLGVDGSNNLVVPATGGELSNGTYYYMAGQLYKTTVKDENYNALSGNLNTTEEYKDMEGKVVLKRTFVLDKDGITVNKTETYYVYDDLGLLRYVIPPKASSQLSLPLSATSDLVKQLCYYYQYDSRNRMVMKQLPGAAPIYMVYDQCNRVVLTQDGERRKDNQWLFTKYDVFNRPVITGVTANRLPLNILQDTVNLRTGYKLYESVTSVAGNIHNYSNNSFPKVNSGDSCLTVTYYDTYTFPGKVDFTSELTNTGFNHAVKGQVTGTKVRILGTTTWLATTNYYDDKYRVIQTIRQNNIGGLDRLTNKYDFPGKILESLYTHTGTKDVTIAKRFEYDHAGRLLRIFHKIDSNPEVLMSYMQYNEIGQLVNKKLHSSDAPHLNYLQSIDYRYNIRGWLTKINGPETVNVPHANEGNMTVKPDAFGMEIRYNDPFNQ